MSSNEPTGQPRYQRTTSGLIAAMVVVVVGVLAVFFLERANDSQATTPIPTVDYASWIRAARSDGMLATWAPTRLPAGWRATSANYSSGSDPHFHLGILTPKQQYVGVEESYDTAAELVAANVDQKAKRGPIVIVAGHSWHTWTDNGGDYVLVRTFRSPGTGHEPETLLIVGTTPPAVVRSFVATLRDP